MAKRQLSSAAKRRGDHVAGWVERFCAHVTGEWAGRPFTLEGWQREWLTEVFGPAGRDGRRKVRTALLGVPRKSGKSTLGAAIALYLLFADGEQGAQVFSCAADRDQARAVFDTARRMVEASPLAKYAMVRRNWIEVPKTGGIYRVLSADAFRHHGLNPHGVIFDELHAQPNRELWDVMTSGQGARSQPLTVAITTAGYDRTSICWELAEYGRQVAAGTVSDPTWHYRWFGAGESEDWTDRKVWRRANPNLGVSVREDWLEGEFRQAELLPARQNMFRRLYLNQWTQASERWIDLAAWDATAGIVDEATLAGRVCYGGLDLAATGDFTAMVWLFPDDDGAYQVVCRFWLPESAVERRSHMRDQLDVWRREGTLRVTDGDVVDYETITADIERDADRFDVREVAFDPWNATQLVQRLADGGMTVWPLRQTTGALSPATKELERLVGEGRFRHGGNPVLRWMADNVVTTQDSNGNIKPDRKRSSEKIDGIVAAVMGLAAATRERQAQLSPLVMFGNAR